MPNSCGGGYYEELTAMTPILLFTQRPFLTGETATGQPESHGEFAQQNQTRKESNSRGLIFKT